MAAREMKLKDFVESTYFKGAARSAMILGAAALGWLGYLLRDLPGRVAAVEMTQESITTTQADRAEDAERFQTFVTREIDEVKSAISDVKVDTATIKGIIQEMQRRDVAQRMSAPL